MLNENWILNTLLNRFNPGISPPIRTIGRTTIKGTYDDPQGMVCGFHIPHIHLPSKFGFYEGEQQNWNVFKHTNFWILIFQGYFHSNIEIYGRRINPSHIPLFLRWRFVKIHIRFILLPAIFHHFKSNLNKLTILRLFHYTSAYGSCSFFCLIFIPNLWIWKKA